MRIIKVDVGEIFLFVFKLPTRCECGGTAGGSSSIRSEVCWYWSIGERTWGYESKRNRYLEHMRVGRDV